VVATIAAGTPADRVDPSDGLPDRDDTVRWQVWSTLTSLTVTDSAALTRARALVDAELAAIDAACSRFRPDSELSRLTARAQEPGEAPLSVSALLADLLATALDAARASAGAVDPTVGSAMRALGYDRDIAEVTALAGHPGVLLARPVPGWQRVRLAGTRLTLPPDVELDLGATAKARAADRCAHLVATVLGVGVLIGIGGDIATAGPAPRGGWPVLVQDGGVRARSERSEPRNANKRGSAQPACTIALPAGSALATSSTITRTWSAGGRRMHHIVDPATGLPAPTRWRTVSVAAPSCVAANTLATTAIVRGRAALAVLGAAGMPARLVDARGRVTTVAAWPA
jgi:thiamine biosynthesis lipoprotein